MEKNRSPGVGYFAGIDADIAADIAAQRFLIRKPPAYTYMFRYGIPRPQLKSSRL